MDKSIIDITGQSLALTESRSSKSRVPFWNHQYVYSLSEIETASNDQRRFYKTYKANFLNGIFMDIEGNSNYAFILLFDLLNEYENHKNAELLEGYLKRLAENYPKTQTYCISFLIKTLDSAGKSEEVERIRREENYYAYDSEYCKLGSVYKSKLELDDTDVLLLNKLYTPSNNFFSIEFCGLEVVKLYLAAIKRLGEKYEKEQTTLNDELKKVADVLVRKNFNYRYGSSNYKYSSETIVNELNSTFFKYAENVVRDCYGHKRKLSIDMGYVSADVNNAEYTDLLNRFLKALAIYKPTISAPERNVEIELNAQNPTRWKIRYGELVNNFCGDSKQFVSDIVILGTWNKKNPGIGNIFYDASKFIAQHDKVSSLKLYVYYLHHDLRSVKFNNRPLAKTLQKKLFTTNSQIRDFQIIVSELIQDKQLDKALNAVPNIYTVKRKRINLDRTAIRRVQEKHSGTVELLNEYLKDEYEDDSNAFKIEQTTAEEMVMEIIPKSDAMVSNFNNRINFSNLQCELMELFVESNLSVSNQDLDDFAKSNGVFKNQLIDSLNEACYEILDDVLVEEEDDYYSINETYYKIILAK